MIEQASGLFGIGFLFESLPMTVRKAI